MANYDIFISYRNCDDNGCPTRDAVMAEALYKALLAKGYSPFFSKYSIDGNGRSDYMTIINNALESAKVLVAVGTSRKNLTSRWVKREINIFSALLMREEEGSRTLLTYRSEDFPVHELPANLADLQSYADEKAVVRFVNLTLQQASGFRNNGNCTEVLYAEDEMVTNILGEDTADTERRDQLALGLKVGDILENRYKILSLVGRGGSSYVFAATDERTNQIYAIKALRRDSNLTFSIIMESLLTETNLLKRLDHPAIPRIIDVIEKMDIFYIVMEYVEGDSLQKLLNEYGAMEESRVLDIARQLGSVLNYLHTQPSPIIYRDMKPANIMLKSDGKVKLLDYGTARRYKEHALSDTTCLGTVGYAAPEQFGGMGQTDARTDIYNLGVTLYHLVTNRNPAEPPYEICPIRQVNPALSAGLEFIVQKCTQKDPQNRFQSAEELLHALDNIHKLGRRSFRCLLLGQKRGKGEKSKKTAETPKAVSSSMHPVMPIVPASSIAAHKQANSEIDSTMEKFAALDSESRRIVRELIDRLSK